jgi:hypothetical protein
MRSLFCLLCRYLCLLRRYLDTLSACDAEYTCNQLGGPRAFVVSRNRVHDDAWVDVRVDNPDSGNMLDGAFADSMKVGYGIKENDKVRNHTFRPGNVKSEEMDLICEGARKPLFTDVVSLRAYTLCGFEDGGAKVGASADKDDCPVPRCNGSYEGSCATKMGQGALEVYDGDIRACSIRVWNEVWVKQRSVMAEVRSSSEKCRNC